MSVTIFKRIAFYLILNEILFQVAAFVSGPTISYCFTTENDQPPSKRCTMVEISNSTFEFGNLQQNILPSYRRGRFNTLLLRCTSSVPVVWMTSKPSKEFKIIPSDEANPDDEDATNPESATFSQWLSVVLFEDGICQRLRCRSYKDDDVVADVFVKDRHCLDGRFGPFGFVTVNVTALTTQIVPFIADAWDGEFVKELKFIRKQGKKSIKDLSDDCVSCICKASCENFPCDPHNFCGNIPEDFYECTTKDNRHREHQDTQCCRGNASCSHMLIKKYLKAKAKDCNGDGIIICEDYARIHLHGPSSDCKKSFEGATEKILATSFKKCLVEVMEHNLIFEIKENFTTLSTPPNEYDPRIGLKLAEVGNNMSHYYESITTIGWFYRSSYYYTLQALQAASVNVTYNNTIGRFYCGHPLTQLFFMLFGICESISQCILIYEPIHPSVLYYAENVLNSLLHKHEKKRPVSNLTSNGYTSSYRHGFVQCYAEIDESGQNIMGEFNYFFTGLNQQIYLASDDIPVDALVRISSSSGKLLTHGIEQNFTCAISTFLLQPNVVFGVEYDNGDTDAFPVGKVSDIATFNEVAPDNPDATLTARLKLRVLANMSLLTCSAPYRSGLRNPAKANISLKPGNNAGDTSKRGNKFAQIGIAAAVITIILATTIFMLKLWRKYSSSEGVKRSLTEDDVYEFHHGARSQVLNDTIIVPENLAFKEDLKISSSEITIGNIVLRTGKFNIFQRGAFANQEVAVKSCSTHADIEYFKSFLNELKVMAHIGEHPNIVKFFGAVVDDIENGIAFAVLELSPYGTLDRYLRIQPNTNGASDLSMVRYGSTGNQVELSTMLGQPTLISFCKQIASGMKYFAEKKGIYTDLAARNILVFEGNIVKITDFGQSTKLYAYSNYISQTQTPLSWQWMALESLRCMEFSSQSDVWSFGVTVWEIFSLGKVPFFDSSWTTEFENQLEAGMRLSKPRLAQQAVYNWMMSCWNKNPENRPIFSECETFFASLEFELNAEQE